MKYYLTLSILLLFLLQGCQEDNVPLNHLEFFWDQTGCSDPWKISTNHSNEEILHAVGDYLSDQGVKGAKVLSITSDGVQQGCYACFCTTGNRIRVTVPKNQKSKLIDLGFQESN